MIEERPLPWQELLEVLFRRRALILAVAVVGLLLAATSAALKPDLYRATARIQISEQAISAPREDSGSRQQIATEVNLLMSPSLVRRVLEDYQKSQHPMEPNQAPISRMKRDARAFLGVEPASKPVAGEFPELRGVVLAGLVAGTNIIEVSYTGHHAEWSAKFVNDLVQHHLRRIAEANDEKKKQGNFFHEQRNELFGRWQGAQTALTNFRNEQGSTMIIGDESHLRRVLSDLEANRVTTETRLLELAARIDFLTSELSLHPDTIAAESRVTENTAVTYLKNRVLELELRRSELLSRYTPTSSRVRDVERQIEEATRLMNSKERETLAEVKTVLNPAYQTLEIQLVDSRAQFSAAEAKAGALATQLSTYRQSLSFLENTSAELERHREDVENAREAYQTYSRREEEARLSSSLDESGIVNITIIDRAIAPRQPLPGKSSGAMVLGLIVGLGFGVICAYFRDILDPTVKGSAHAFRLSGLPVISEIPSR
jgi:uncharacterized protein involved in exopolysaccharide biosynthesis